MNTNAIALDALKKIVKNAEQSKFEDWLEAESPSGDVEQVQSQWENSGMYHAFCDKWADAFAAIAALEAEPQDGDVEQALNRMDALLDPSLNLLAVSENSITLQGCRADMLTIRRALRMAPAAREGWQPIETAPKDWILLLGYFNESGKWRTVRGEWFCQEEIDDQWEFPENGRPGWYETCVNADDPPNCWPIEPTHWMPLPTPPKD